jgi:hypothetical protein
MWVHGVLLTESAEDLISMMRKKVFIMVWIFGTGRAIVGC